MEEKDYLIPIHEFAFLQAYLYGVFSSKVQCENSFTHSEWFLKEKHTDEEVTEIQKCFNDHGIFCDCDIISKVDLRERSGDLIIHHGINKPNDKQNIN